MSEEPEICSACGAKIVEYKHSLSKSQAVALQLFAEAAGDGPVHLKEVAFTRSQWINFQKLRYFGIVRRVTVGDAQRSGVWEMTDLGWRFLAGKVAVTARVWTYRGEVVELDEREVYIHELTGGYARSEEYAATARAHRRLPRRPKPRESKEADRRPSRATPQARPSKIPSKADERKYGVKSTRRAQSKSPAIQRRDEERARRAAARAAKRASAAG